MFTTTSKASGILGPFSNLLLNCNANEGDGRPKKIAMSTDNVRRYVIPFLQYFISQKSEFTWLDVFKLVHHLDAEGVKVVENTWDASNSSNTNYTNFFFELVHVLKNSPSSGSEQNWDTWKKAWDCAEIFKNGIFSYFKRNKHLFNSNLMDILSRLESYTEKNCGNIMAERTSFTPSENEPKSDLRIEIRAISFITEWWVEMFAVSSENVKQFSRIILELLSFLKCAQMQSVDDKLNEILRSFLFKIGSKTRATLMKCLRGDFGDMSSWVGLPICCATKEDSSLPDVSFLHSLCTFDLIDAHPIIVLILIQVHAAHCTIPRPNLSGVIRSDFRATNLINGLDAQHEWISCMLTTVYNRILDESIEFKSTKSRNLQRKYIENITALTFSDNVKCRNVSRHLLLLLMNVEHDPPPHGIKPIKSWRTFNFIYDPVGPGPKYSQIFSDMYCFLQGETVLNGLLKVVKDLRVVPVAFTDEAGKSIVGGVDECLEGFLSFVQLTLGSDEFLVKHRGMVDLLESSLVEMTKLQRCAVSTTFRMILENGAKKKIPGCAEMLTANESFVASKQVVLKVPSSTAIDQLKSTKVAPVSKELSSSLSRSVVVPREDEEEEEDFLGKLERQEQNEMSKSFFGRRKVDVQVKPTPGSKEFRSSEEIWKQQLEELKKAKMDARNVARNSKEPVYKSAVEAAAAKDILAAVAQPKKATALPANTCSNGKRKNSNNDTSFLDSDDDGDDESEEDENPPKRKKDVHSTNGFLMLAAKLGLNAKSSTAPQEEAKGQPKRSYSELYRAAMQRGQYGENGGASSSSSRSVAETLMDISADSLLTEVLKLNLLSVYDQAESGQNGTDSSNKESVNSVGEESRIPPIRFLHEDQYIANFEPLLIDEVKAALGSQITQWRTQHGGKKSYLNHSGGGGARDFSVTPLKFLSSFVRPSCKDISEVQLKPSAQGRSRCSFVKDDLILILHVAVPKGNQRS